MNFNDATTEFDVPKKVKEDMLRILGERRGKVSLEDIRSETKDSSSLILKTIRSLEQEKLIRVENKYATLTKKGKYEAKDIIRKHTFLETYELTINLIFNQVFRDKAMPTHSH